jgi:RHS repeat-associated protein
MWGTSSGRKVTVTIWGNKLVQEVANGTTTVYQYDENGNTVSKTTGTSQVRYYWDDEDKMVRVEDSVVMNFKVDGLGFRRMKEVVGQYQRWFVYDLAASEVPGLAPLLAEYDESGNLVAKYHYDGGGLIAMTRNNESYWYGFEGIGTVRQLMGSQGQVVDAYAFDAWDNEITNPQSQVQNPFKYVGKHGYYSDTESALMLLGMRYYGANIGRFLNLDPMKDDKNWFLYCGNNPVVRNDISGLSWFSEVFCEKGPGYTCCHKPIYGGGPGGSLYMIWCPRKDRLECQICAQSEGFRDIEAYCKQYDNWLKQEPKATLKDIKCAYDNVQICRNCAINHCPQGADKCLHCVTSCCLTGFCGKEGAEYAGWCREMQQLTDCKKSVFDPKDHEANKDGINVHPYCISGCKNMELFLFHKLLRIRSILVKFLLLLSLIILSLSIFFALKSFKDIEIDHLSDFNQFYIKTVSNYFYIPSEAVIIIAKEYIYFPMGFGIVVKFHLPPTKHPTEWIEIIASKSNLDKNWKINKFLYKYEKDDIYIKLQYLPTEDSYIVEYYWEG